MNPNAHLRRESYDRGDCPNGPDEYGNWPCDPAPLFGAPAAECQVCGRVAGWTATASDSLSESDAPCGGSNTGEAA